MLRHNYKMTEKEFIKKIHCLRQIKPSQNWVVLTKKRIFEQEKPIVARQNYKQEKIYQGAVSGVFSIASQWIKGVKIAFSHKFAFALVLCLVILFGLFGFAQKSLPGDFLFPLKKIAENSRAIFVFQKDQSNYDFEVAQKRLDDLIKIAQKNSVKNLAPAINEYQANISKVAGNLAKEKEKKKIKKMILKMAELQNKEEKVKSYGVEIGDNKELEKVYIQKVIETLEPLIKDLRKRNLTEEQKKDLAEAEKYLAEKKYEQALLKLLYINQ